MVAPATGQKEAPPQWYDIDVVKGTQYTVTGYQVPFEDPTMKVRAGQISHLVAMIVLELVLNLCVP